MKTKVNENIYNIGVNDYDIDLFEGQYILENGMAYNSYIVLDNKIAVLDTVDKIAVDRWFDNLADALGDKKPDYLIVQHLEPDHSFGIQKFIEKYPDTVLYCSASALRMLPQFCDVDLSKVVAVKEGDTLDLGTHKLNFVMAPMVHWPEVMVTYDSTDKVLFSADAFGKFGTTDADEGWSCEARRYYFNIVGKYGKQVQALLKKAGALEIKTICPLHGPVLTDTIPEVLAYTTLGRHINLKTRACLSLAHQFTETQCRRQRNLKSCLKKKAVRALSLPTSQEMILQNVLRIRSATATLFAWRQVMTQAFLHRCRITFIILNQRHFKTERLLLLKMQAGHRAQSER